MVLQNLGLEMCRCLLFAHAIAGCDTTSRLFGIGKGVPLKKLSTSSAFRGHAQLFTTAAPRGEILKAGERALVSLYNGKEHESLDNLLYRRFTEKVLTSMSPVQVHTLPPTSAAAHYHILRVYYQVQEWMDKHNGLDPTEWGWVQ